MTKTAAGDARRGLLPAAALFRSLADPARLAIIRHLAAREARVVDLIRELGLAQSTVSAHLACLRDCGLVDARPSGRASVYSLRQPALTDLLGGGRGGAGGDRQRGALCPNYGQAQ
jgi:DNA-binding transcriptional ArsR family regulator